MRTIAIVARKGGSGKTTVSVHLALAAHLSGRRTLVADTDPQRSTSEVFHARRDAGPTVLACTSAELLGMQVRARKQGFDCMIIDTPAGTEEAMSNAVVLADLSLLVIRPTFLDLTAAAHTAHVLRRLKRPGLAVINQAPAARDGVEPPAVRKAYEVLKLMRLPAIPTVLRGRGIYQTAMESGRSAVEIAPGEAAAQEIAAFWAFLERFVFGERG